MWFRALPPPMLPSICLTLPTLLVNLVLPLGAAAEEGDKGLDPVIAAAARATVAIEVDREAEPPRLSRRASTLRLPVDFVDYRRRPEGPATGLLLDREGHILTSYYNVSGNVKKVEVVLADLTRRPARIVASDKGDDLALLRLEDPPAGLEAPELKWAEPGKLRVGRIVVAIGRAPDPGRPTATFGIISSVGRNGGRALQTDAELNYGNVGGPLVDLDGAIVGLSTFVGHTYEMWGQNSGIGFATTSDTIRSVLPGLRGGKDLPKPERPFLGVGMSESALEAGVSIGTVQPNSAAAQAGLRPGDVVISIDGEPLQDFMDLRRYINRKRPGEEAVLKVRRGSEDLELKIKLGRMPE